MRRALVLMLLSMVLLSVFLVSGVAADRRPIFVDDGTIGVTSTSLSE